MSSHIPQDATVPELPGDSILKTYILTLFL